MDDNVFDSNGIPPSPGRSLGLLSDAKPILVSQIVEGVQTRAGLDEAAIAEFARAMKRHVHDDGTVEGGDSFPPLLVYKVDESQTFLLAGGHHRLRAAKLAGLDTVLCRVREGSELDAYCASAADNAQNQAIRRTNSDKRAAVVGALERWPEFWDEGRARELAKRLEVSHSLVNKIKSELRPPGNVSTPNDADEVSDDADAPALPRENRPLSVPTQAVTSPEQIREKVNLLGVADSYVQPSISGQKVTRSPEPAVGEPQPSSTTPEPSSTVGAIPGATGEVACETQTEVTDKLSVTSASEPSLARAEAAAKVRSRVGEICRRAVALERCLGQHPLPVREAAEQSRALRMVTQVFEGDFEKLMAAA